MRKLQRKYFLSFFVPTMVVIAILLVSFRSTIYNGFYQTLCQTRVEKMDLAKSNVESTLNMMQFAVSLGPFQREFREVLQEDMDMTEYERLQFQKRIRNMFANYSDTYQNLKIQYYIALYGFNGLQYCSHSYFDFSAFENAPWMEQVRAADGQIAWITTHDDVYIANSSNKVFIAARMLKNSDSSQPVGILSMIVDEASLHNVYLLDHAAEDETFLVDQSGVVVSHCDKSRIGERWDGFSALDQSDSGQLITNNTILTYARVEGPNWYVVECMPLDTVTRNATVLILIYLLISVFCFLADLLIAAYLSRRITKPIATLQRGMQKVSAGDLTVRLDGHVSDEFQGLFDGFHYMASSLNALIEEIGQREKERREAEVRLLQSQINPHFICNTLSCIRCSVLMDKNKAAAENIAILARMLRNLLDTDQIYCTLDDEIRYLRDYIDIRRSEIGREIVLDCVDDPAILACQIPKLTIQPIVENSLFHGLEKIQGTIHISITAVREKDTLLLTVTDNGYMDEQIRIQLQEQFQSQEEIRPHHGHHIGLANIDRRLKQLYGCQYGLTLPHTDTGTVVQIRLPLVGFTSEALNYEERGHTDEPISDFDCRG